VIHNLPFIFTPLIPLPVLEGAAACATVLTFYAIYHGVRGGIGRGIVFALLFLILSNPSFLREQREPLKDTALVVIDDSASMKIADRPLQSAKAAEAVSKKLALFSDLDVETLHVKGMEETDLFHAIEQKLTDIPADRLAGVVAITDGEIQDKPTTLFSTPFHVLIAGHRDEIDRRIVIKEAPAYGIVGKDVTLTLRIEDQPRAQSESATVQFQRDNGESKTITMPIGEDVQYNLPIDHAGQNLFVFSTPPLPHELTTVNNTVATTINGIRDRLRVLLVSGQPHIGERTWRNFLKADPAVDLVHFTILRSPMKPSMVPNNELSLIAFPVQELFATKLTSFDLVILDRFSQQSLVANEYLDNIARYVENGGALLVSNATDDNRPPLSQSPLARILPSEPTGTILTGAFVPDLTASGHRHPVTSSLTANMPRDQWGHWFRQIDARALKGDVVMTGLHDQPLLILSHVGKGRVAQFLSDQFWLWSRGFEGGGPQAELLRRTAHWLVQEPDLDEDALRVRTELTDDGGQLFISKQSLHENSAGVTIADPNNQLEQATLTLGPEPGVLSATVHVKQTGLYHVKDDHQEVLAVIGPTDAPEFGTMRATEDRVSTVVSASGGAINWLDDYPSGPDIRRQDEGAVQQGWGWIGLRKNGQYRVTGDQVWPLMPPLAAIVIVMAMLMLVWRREGH
jgi:hypothetical protein